MTVIYKYPLAIARHQKVEMPAVCKPLCLQEQYGAPCLWAEVDPNADKVWREIAMIGTGHEFNPLGMFYIGTFQDGAYVWHFYMEQR